MYPKSEQERKKEAMMPNEEKDLLERLAKQMGCCYISDLKNLDSAGKGKLAQELLHISADAYSLRQWNNALEYLVKQPIQDTAEAAYALLCSALSDAAEASGGRQ